jgi:1-acyl-sn-glycerol-3-phosphate acyltransferase
VEHELDLSLLRPASLRDRSTNAAWLAVPSLGDAWHHNHHAFPRSAVHGMRWWELDLSGLFIRALEHTCLAWNVVRIAPERKAAAVTATAAPSGNRFVYWVVRQAMLPVFVIMFRLRRDGREHLRHDGPMILAANHRSVLDPIVVALLQRRRVFYIAKSELFRHRLVAWFYRSLGAFPVQRGGGDQQAIDISLEVLRRGDCLVIFPEGRCIPAGPLGAPRRGVGRLALATGAPIVPIAITGTELGRGSRWRWRRIAVTAGAPLAGGATPRPLPQDAAAEVTDRVWAAVTTLWTAMGPDATRARAYDQSPVEDNRHE